MRTIIAMSLLVSTSHAAAVLVGNGAVTCGEFAQQYGKNVANEVSFFDWAQGYMSGMNDRSVLEFKQYHDLLAKSISEQKAFIRSYCNTKPLAYYADAIEELYLSLPMQSGTR